MIHRSYSSFVCVQRGVSQSYCDVSEKLADETPSNLAGMLSRSWLLRRGVAPSECSNGDIACLMLNPSDGDAIAALEFAAGQKADIRSAPAWEIEEAITAFDRADKVDAGDASSDELLLSPTEPVSDPSTDAPIIRLVQLVLADAVRRRASDIHIEPMSGHVAVRYRIDGALTEVEQLPAALASPVASRIKIMASLDIAESRLPQDGRLRLSVGGRDVDVRVATSPIAHGESIVLRLLGRSEVALDLDTLGIAPDLLERLKLLLDRPHGMILVTGPTGSGKTTTLYAALERLRRPEVKILTVEDPVEILIEGINQVQVRPNIDLDYAATLRAFLRQDPDILMVGEIRDRDTADIAMRAALTGHLVLSTLHTNSALGAFTRLRDIGIEPFLTASTVVASLAQRLVRKLCTHCHTARPPDPSETALFEAWSLPVPALLHEPHGCDACGHSGWRGRHMVMELVEVDDALRSAIREDRVDALDRQRSPQTLGGHGLKLAAEGVTSLDEVRRVVDIG